MTSPQPRVVSTTRDQLGEGPHWDKDRSELVFVDIAGGIVRGWSAKQGEIWQFTVNGEVSAAIPRAGGGLLLARGHALVLRAPNGMEKTIALVESGLEHTRFNDCRCDPVGRLWAGTMSKERRPGTAALYRMGTSGALEQVVRETTISNGIGWSPEGDLMYFIDSLTQRIDVFDYDLSTGDMANRRVLAEVPVDDGMPDGLTVDSEGCVWVCLFGGGAVRRYGPEGTLEAHVALPVTNPTCPVFGDDDLRTLYITSARHRLSPDRLLAEPEAGALLALEAAVTGQPGNTYAG